jgi:tetratricopeptide (TPR) repeat protein
MPRASVRGIVARASPPKVRRGPAEGGYHRRAVTGRNLVATVLFAAALAACGGSGPPANESAADALTRGLQAQFAGKYDEATAAYFVVLTKDPKNTAAFFNLGLIAHLQSRLTAAESYYRLALEQDPNFVKALFNLAIVRATIGQNQDAVALYRKVIALEPDYADAHFNLAIVLRQLGQTAESQQEFATAQRLDPKLVAPSASATPARPASPSPTR